MDRLEFNSDDYQTRCPNFQLICQKDIKFKLKDSQGSKEEQYTGTRCGGTPTHFIVIYLLRKFVSWLAYLKELAASKFKNDVHN
jgi:hypothetical protein